MRLVEWVLCSKVFVFLLEGGWKKIDAILDGLIGRGGPGWNSF